MEEGNLYTFKMDINIKDISEVKQFQEFIKWVKEKPDEWKQFKEDMKWFAKEMEELLDELS